jgi:hypothetical protein
MVLATSQYGNAAKHGAEDVPGCSAAYGVGFPKFLSKKQRESISSTATLHCVLVRGCTSGSPEKKNVSRGSENRKILILLMTSKKTGPYSQL